MTVLSASIVIATKNRIDELRVALRSAFSQRNVHEVIVIDDGSTDGSSEMVAREYPQARLYINQTSIGYIASRNIGANLATGDVVFSVDDDAEFSSPDICERILPLFASPRIAAVAIPYREPYKENILRQFPIDPYSVWITNSFIGTSHAIRRDLFLELGGYRESLVHQGEEDDFAIRLLDNGFFVALGVSPEILHYESPKRDFRRMDYYGARNQLLWVWSYTPLLILPFFFLLRFFRQLQFALHLNRSHRQFQGIRDAFLEISRGWHRSPVTISSFLLFFRLKRRSFLLSKFDTGLGGALTPISLI
jgi:GT2 family glycosyltransferase